MKSKGVTIQMKATEQHFPVVLFIMLYKVVLAFESVNEILKVKLLMNGTSFPGLFPFELGRREKTLASAGHVPILHPKILGVIN